MQTLCFFNNKGGVGKTTLITNIASYLATALGLKVLLVDLDPQCNTTQLIVPEEEQEALFGDEKGAGTILSVIEPIQFGDPIISAVLPLRAPADNKFGVSLLPGHPSLSLFEDTLSTAWLGIGSSLPVGLRQSLWIEQLKTNLKNGFDLVFIDVGPSFGALNRTVLLGADYFVSPLGCDLFSIIGIKNIGLWLMENKDTLSKGLARMEEERGKEALERYGLVPTEIHFAEFVGYTVLQYITKSKGGVRRPTEAFEKFRRVIPKVVEDALKTSMPNALTIVDCDLGDVPNMYSIVPLSQYAQKPIHLLQGSDGLAGAAFAQHQGYVEFIKNLALRLHANLKALSGSPAA